MTQRDLRDLFQEKTGTELSERQAYRWVNGEVKSLPYAHAQGALERIFDEPASQLLGPPHGSGLVRQHRSLTLGGGVLDREQPDWQQVIAVSARRARDFLSRMEVSNVGSETLDQLGDDVRRLAVAYQQEPLEDLLEDMSETQAEIFRLLDGRQKVAQTRELHLLAGVASGLMARACHDNGASDEALTHARVVFSSADHAGHDGLKAWARGLQSLIAYWAGRYDAAVDYARRGAEFAALSRNTSAVWLAAGEARSLAALGRQDEARHAVERAVDARDRVRRDDLDELGGFCTFNSPRQLYYAAEALSWGGEDAAEDAERYAVEAIEAYGTADETDRAFGDEAGTRCALAISRINRGEIEGAAEALQEVVALPIGRRTHGVVTAVQHVERHLGLVAAESRAANELEDLMNHFTAERLALPQ
ncbi:hypothetical protein A4R44_08700 [Amycolatopsis sp. M39]|nr:hypothetical protein A4R44_08700 [Amycolatopsis sp. M39]